MDGNQRKYKGQVEINDLIGDAVKNAVFRRHQVIDSENALSALSDEEARGIAGGQQIKDIEVVGLKPICPPIIVGIIATDPPINQIS